MPVYPNGAALLADARQRLRKLGNEYGALIVEGGDEYSVYSRRAISRPQVVPAGGKQLLLDAHGLLQPGEDMRVLFIADCDYDVPTGMLHPQKNLILSKHPALETDMIAIPGALEELLLNVLPFDPDRDLSDTAAIVLDRAVAVASVLGRLRWAGKQLNVHVNVDIPLEQIRPVGTAEVREDLLLQIVLQKSPAAAAMEDQLRGRSNALDSGLIACHGHDIVKAVADVLERDFGTRRAVIRTLPEMIRLACAGEFDQLEAAERIRAWEIESGRRILR